MMEFDGINLQVNTDWFMESVFFSKMSYFQDCGHWLPASPPSAYDFVGSLYVL